MIAKLGQGLSCQQVARDLACVPSTVVKAARRFAWGGEEALLDQRAFNSKTKVDAKYLAELGELRRNGHAAEGLPNSISATLTTTPKERACCPDGSRSTTKCPTPRPAVALAVRVSPTPTTSRGANDAKQAKLS